MNAVVLGSAGCLRDDMARLLDFGPWEGGVIAVNESGVFYTGQIDFWVTLHGEKLDWWRSLRQGNGDYLPIVSPPCDGSSGGAAVVEGLKHFDKLVLCGVPMDSQAHLRRGGNWSAFENHRPWWTEQDFDDRVRSMSGWTRELLGTPDTHWLEE